MKAFADLTVEEKDKAKRLALDNVLNEITMGTTDIDWQDTLLNGRYVELKNKAQQAGVSNAFVLVRLWQDPDFRAAISARAQTKAEAKTYGTITDLPTDLSAAENVAL